MKMATTARSNFAWSAYLPPLRRAIAEQRGATFCLEQGSQLLPLAARESAGPDVVHILQTTRALFFLEDWWFRGDQSGIDAAIHLNRWTRNELRLRQAAIVELARVPTPGSPSSFLSSAVARLAELETDKTLYPAVATALSGYTPLKSSKNPYRLLEEAVDEQLRRRGIPGERFRRRTDLGGELRRRFELHRSDPDRERLEIALARMSREDVDILRLLYTQGTKAAQRLGLSGRRRDALRRHAVMALIDQLPELTVFLPADKLRS